MASRFVQPESVKLDISGGDWLLIKRRLNAGEARRMMNRIMKPIAVRGEVISTEGQLDTLETGRAMVLAYLLDWSLVNEDGSSACYADASEEARAAMLDNLDLDSFQEIGTAIQAHHAAMDLERAEEKKRRSAIKSSPTWQSHGAAVGAMNG